MGQGRWWFDPLGLEGRIALHEPSGSAGAEGVVGSKRRNTDRAAKDRLAVLWQPLVWVVTMLGVLASKFVADYRAGTPNWTLGDWPELVFAAIVSFVLVPAAVAAAKPPTRFTVLVELSKVFAHGMAWESLLGAALQLAQGALR